MAKKITVEDTKLLFRNFEGRKTKYNKEGDRNFHIVLDKETADAMDKDDWFITVNQPKDEDGEILYSIKVRIGEFDEPFIYIIGDNGKPVKLNKGQYKRIDRFIISKVDAIFHQTKKTFEYQGREYHSAYLDKLFVTIVEDSLDKKYGTYESMPDPSEEGEIPFD